MGLYTFCKSFFVKTEERLAVQDYLLNHSYEDLGAEFGFEHKIHETLPLVILDYNMLKTPKGMKTHPIVRECRGLILDTRNRALVAKSFDRFFNYGEIDGETFDFHHFTTYAKEDGSLIKIYFFEGQWHINTRFSFGDGNCQDEDFSWEEAVLKALGFKDKSELQWDKRYTWLFELCSPWNKVVRYYERPKMVFLSAFEKNKEISEKQYDELYKNISSFCDRVEVFPFSTIDDVKKALKSKEETDPTFEGFVLRDKHGRRLKVKSASYLNYAYALGNGSWVHPRYLIVFVHDGDVDELLAYHPEVRKPYEEMKATIDRKIDELWELWENHKHKEKRDFFNAVEDNVFRNILLNLHSRNKEATKHDLFLEWRTNEDLVLHKLYNVRATLQNMRHKKNYDRLVQVSTAPAKNDAAVPPPLPKTFGQKTLDFLYKVFG